MNLNLENKVVAITGGSSGIGKATAEAFAAEGSLVAVCARSVDKLEAMKKDFEDKGFRLFTMSVDVNSKESIYAFAAAVVREYGRLDVWINNVGANTEKSVLEMDDETWDGIMKTNVNSYLYGTQAAARQMKQTGGGAIVNTSSIASIIPSVYKSSYGVSKYAVNGLTRISAGELAPFGIRVNGVAPGSTNTPLAQKVGRDYSKLLKSNAIQRLAEPEEIANAFVFLASDAASYITGVTLEVSGGKFLLQDTDRAYQEMR